MAATLIQHAELAASSDASGNQTVTFSSQAVAGNLIVLWANSDATVALGGTTSGYTNAVTDVNGNGCYTWYKIAAGTETAATFVTGVVNERIASGMLEYSGIAVSPFDVAAHAYATDDALTSPPVAITTTQTDLLVAFQNLKGLQDGTPSAGTWDNGINQVAAAINNGSTATDCATFVGDIRTGVTAGSLTITGSYAATGPTGRDREANVVAFVIGGPQTFPAVTTITFAAAGPAGKVLPVPAQATISVSAFPGAVNPTFTGATGVAAITLIGRSTSASVFVHPGWSRDLPISSFLLKDATTLLLKDGNGFALKGP